MSYHKNLFVRPIVKSGTKDFQTDVNKMLVNYGPLTSIYCWKEVDYANGVAVVWPSDVDNLWIIEHDIIPTTGTITEIENCNYLLCVPLYISKPSHTGLKSDIIPHRFIGNDGKPHWIDANQNWADIAGLGCIKFNRLIRKEIPNELFKGCHWKNLDTLLTRVITDTTGFQIHVHHIWVEHRQEEK